MTEAATNQGVDQASEIIDPEIVEANRRDPESTETEQTQHADRKETERERVIREMAERRRDELVAGENEFREAAGAEAQPGVEEFPQHEEKRADMMTIKVDGVEKLVPIDDVLEHGKRALQKESAADKRMEEAARMRADAERRAQEVEALARQMQAQKEQDKGRQLSAQDAADLKTVAADVYSKIMSGDEDAAIEAMANMMGRGNATPDVGAMVEEAKRVARAEIQAERQARDAAEATKRYEVAKADFGKNYPDIGKDPMLYRLADAETLKVIKDHPEWDVRRDVDKILMEAGKRVMDWRGKNTQSTKQDLKRSLRNVRGADVRSQGAPEKRQKTASEIIADQRAARGLPNY